MRETMIPHRLHIDKMNVQGFEMPYNTKFHIVEKIRFQIFGFPKFSDFDPLKVQVLGILSVSGLTIYRFPFCKVSKVADLPKPKFRDQLNTRLLRFDIFRFRECVVSSFSSSRRYKFG